MTTITSTHAASAELKKLRAEQAELNASLKAAADNKLADVATYARILAAQRPLLRVLVEEIAAIPLAQLPSAPDIETLAAELGVNLEERPAADLLAEMREALEECPRRVVGFERGS